MNNIKLIGAIFLLLLFSCGKKTTTQIAKEPLTSTYYFIRHAEKDRSDSLNKNPHLSETGKQRAEYWSVVFKNVKFDAVYSTDFNRTKETTLPTASKNNVELTIYDSKTMDISTFLKETQGKTVLIVGHSNTTPSFVNAVLGNKKYDDIDDSNNSNLYIITVSGNHISDILLKINLPNISLM